MTVNESVYDVSYAKITFACLPPVIQLHSSRDYLITLKIFCTMPGEEFEREMSLAVKHVGMFDNLDEAAQQHLVSKGGGVVQINAVGKSKWELYHLLFGDQTETIPRHTYYNAIVKLSDRLNERELAGWAVRSSDDNGIDTLQTTDDYHVWLEDTHGTVFDYPDKELCVECQYKTDKIVRQEWREDLVGKIAPRIEAWALEVIRLNINLGTDERGLLEHIMRGTFPPNMANVRAKVLYNANPGRYKQIIGSLGFIQGDGRIYWELG